jgi:hypothetical protein
MWNNFRIWIKFFGIQYCVSKFKNIKYPEFKYQFSDPNIILKIQILIFRMKIIIERLKHCLNSNINLRLYIKNLRFKSNRIHIVIYVIEN